MSGDLGHPRAMWLLPFAAAARVVDLLLTHRDSPGRQFRRDALRVGMDI